MKVAFWLAAVVLAAAFGAGCGGEDFDSPPGYDGAVTNLDSFDPMTYHSAWKGDVALPGDQPGDGNEVTTEHWLELVAEVRDEGLMAMDEDDRSILLHGSIKAYLILVENTQRELEAEGVGSAAILEQYSLENGLFTALEARETTESGLLTYWGDAAFAEEGTSTGKVFVSSFTANATTQEWELGDDGAWTCRQNNDASGGLWLLQAEYYQILAGTALLGSLERAETFSGRPTVLFKHSDRGRTRRVWINESTLFPIGYSLPPETHEGLSQFQLERC